MDSIYDQWAGIYDSVYSHVLDDIPFYVDEARRAGGPVLELGCGTGRVTIPVAQAGIDIVGVDSSPRMLDVARGKTVALSESSGTVTLVEADMRDVDLAPATFNLVTIPFRSFLSLLSVPDQMQTLDNIRSLLAPGGRLVFNVFAPDLNMLVSTGDTPYHYRDVTDPATGMRWVLWHQSSYDNYNQIIDCRQIAEELDDDGVVARKIYRDFQIRYVHVWEMRHLLARCGYQVIDLFGDFERTPFDEASTEMVWVTAPGG